MANEDLTVRLKADDQLTKTVKDAAKAVKDLDGTDVKVKVGADTDAAKRDIDGLLQKVDKLGGGDAANLLLTTNASQITNEIADLVVKLDTLDANDPMVDITVANIGQLQGDLDQISTKAKEINDTPIKLDTTQATTGIDQIGKSADSSKSVLANMVGNATQDLGALGGIAGSAGVAIGQMGEYMVDAANSGDKFKQVLSNFAAVAGPIALIATAVQVASGYMADNAAKAEAAAERVKQMGDAMSDAGDDVVGIADSLRETSDALRAFDSDAEGFGGGIVEGIAEIAKNIPLLGGLVGDKGQGFKNLVPVMDAAGLSMYDFAAAIEEGGSVTGDWQRALSGALHTGKISESQYNAMSQAVFDYSSAAKEATAQQELFNVSGDEAAAIFKDLKIADDPLKAFAGSFKVVIDDLKNGGDIADATATTINRLSRELGIPPSDVIAMAMEQIGTEADAAGKKVTDAFTQWAEEAAQAEQGARAFAETVGSIEFGLADTAGALTAMGLFNDMLFAQDNQIIKNEESFKALSESIKENGANFDVSTEAGRANQSALEGVARSLEDELAAAYADANGSQEVFEQTAGRLAHDTLARLQSELGLSAEETFALAAELGLLPADIVTRYELSGAEEAKLKLGLLQTSIDLLPKDVQATVTQQIIAGDYVGALKTVEDYVAANPPSMIVGADITEAQAKADEAQAYADSLVGTEAVDAEIAEAQAKADAAKAYADSLEASIGMDGDAAKARAEAAAAKAYADSLTASIKINAAKGSGWDQMQSWMGGALSRTVNAVPGTSMARTPTTGVTPTGVTPTVLGVTALGPTAPTGPTVTPTAVPVGGTGFNAPGGLADTIWKQILFSLEQLTALTQEGNDTAGDVSQMLAALDLAEVGGEQRPRISTLVMDLNDELRSGNAGGQETLDAMKRELSATIGESILTGWTRFEDGSFGPQDPAWVQFEDGSFGPVVAAIEAAAAKPVEAETAKKEAAKAKEDPNTSILLKISDTLLGMSSWDKTASQSLSLDIQFLAQTLQAMAFDPTGAVRAATMTIQAGAA